MSARQHPRGLRLSLPATSANLGPGFDAVGLAISMHLTVEAHAAPAFAITASGRDAELCAVLENNLIVDTYADMLHRAGAAVIPLHLTIHNEIPLGMEMCIRDSSRKACAAARFFAAFKTTPHCTTGG